MHQPLVRPEDRESRIGEAHQQVEPNTELPRQGRKLITPLPTGIELRRDSRSLRVPLIPRQPASRDVREIAPQTYADNDNAERNRDDPRNEIAAHSVEHIGQQVSTTRGFETPGFRTEK